MPLSLPAGTHEYSQCKGGRGYSALEPASRAYLANRCRLPRVLNDFQAFGKKAGLIKNTVNVDDFVMTGLMQAVKDGK